MTSSFTLPGGGFALFRAEAKLAVTAGRDASRESSRREKVPAYWVQVKDPATRVPVSVEPPKREPDYVGQIIAVAVTAELAASAQRG